MKKAESRQYKEISQAELKRVRSNLYVQNLYLHVLVKSTLRCFDLVSEEEANDLEAVVISGTNDALLPELEHDKAKEVIIRFFDTLNISSDKELKQVMDSIKPDTLVPSIFEGVLYNTDSIQSLILADRTGLESYRVLLAYKMGQPIDAPAVDKQMAKYLAFVYVYPSARDPLDVQISEMISAGGDPNQPGRGYSWGKYNPKFAKIIVPSDMYSNGKPRQINPRTEKWSIASSFVKPFLFRNGHTTAFVLELDHDHFFYPSDFCFLPLVAQRIEAEPNIGMITFLTGNAVDKNRLPPCGFNENAIMELGGMWNSETEKSAAAVEDQMQIIGYRVVHDPRLYVEQH